MKFSWTTIITAFVTSFLVPLLATKVSLTPDQTAALSAALVGGITTLAHLIDIARAKKPTASLHTMLPILMLAGALACTLSLSACATPGTVQYASEQAAVEAGTGILIQAGSSDPTVWQARAAQVATVAKDVEALDTGDAVTIAALTTQLQRQIVALNPGPAYVLAANQLITVFGSVLEQMAQTGTGPLNAGQRAAVASVLGWIEQAAQAYTAQARALHAAMTQ